MKFQDIAGAFEINVWVKPIDTSKSLSEGDAQVQFGSEEGFYDFIIDEEIVTVELRDTHQRGELDHLLNVRPARLARIVLHAKDGTALARMVFFNGEIEEFGEVEVGIDERILGSAKKSCLDLSGSEPLEKTLQDNCAIHSDAGEQFFIFTAGPAADEEFEKGAEDEDESRALSDKNKRCFCICGDGVRLPVERRSMTEVKEIFYAERLISHAGKRPDNALRLARGKLSFIDLNDAGAISALTRGMVQKLVRSDEGYIRKWDQYGDIEGQMLLERARDVGKLNWNNAEVDGSNGVWLSFENPIPKGLSVEETLLFLDSPPEYLKNRDMTWEQYRERLKENYQARKSNKGGAKPEERLTAVIKKLGPKSLLVDLPEEPKTRIAVLSIHGDEVQIERRMNARLMIEEQRSANPYLLFIIEEEGFLPDIARPNKTKALSPAVSRKVFKGNATRVQLRAVEIALRTPDVALIQGPPGTGKTTVITAIIERLNELSDKTGSIKGKILVSGFQHDAVENIVSRLNVNSLPGVKFGRQSGLDIIGVDEVRANIRSWCQEIAEKVRDNNPRLKRTEGQRKLQRLMALYIESPSTGHALSLLDMIMSLPADAVSVDITERARGIRDSLDQEMSYDPEDELKIKLLRSFRVTAVGFCDDGPERAKTLLAAIDEFLGEADKNLLRKAAFWKPDDKLEFLPKLKQLKARLLKRYMPRPSFRIEKPRGDVLGLVRATGEELVGSRLKKEGEESETILADFLHDMENDDRGIVEAVEDYNFVFAATCQQAEGNPIRQAKNNNFHPGANQSALVYDVVIIDEAARTSPRDLLIPMVQGKRIILVGDHRQLPHILNEEIARQLETDKDGKHDNAKFLKNSMFEYLKTRLEKLQEQDGIQRTITLDTQFRMHPKLGAFVSRHFYERFDKKEKFKSGIGAGSFAHNLPGFEDKAAGWLDVTLEEGKEKQSSNKSRCRVAEAVAIAEKLKTWMDSEAGAQMSFGVISFYKEQRREIFKAAAKYGLTEKSGNAWRISEDYKFVQDDEGRPTKQARLRIGTVDSFQGREFDVVFLSMVRSQRIRKKTVPNEGERKRQKQRFFGHLMSTNRLCVSMSRQKSLLVVAGDSEMLGTELAEEAVPSLCRFLEHCKKDEWGGMV
jgi:hypothetical protein